MALPNSIKIPKKPERNPDTLAYLKGVKMLNYAVHFLL